MSSKKDNDKSKTTEVENVNICKVNIMEGIGKATPSDYLTTLNCIDGLAMCLIDNDDVHKNIITKDAPPDCIGMSILKIRAGHEDLMNRLNDIKKLSLQWKKALSLGVGYRTHPHEKSCIIDDNADQTETKADKKTRKCTQASSKRLCCVPWCDETLCRNRVRSLPTASANGINLSDKQMARISEAKFKRNEECERLGLGRNADKQGKDWRYCDNHPLELVKGKKILL